MKKIVVISILSVLLYSSMGYFFIYPVAKYMIHLKIKKNLIINLPDSELFTLVINPSNKAEIHWYEKGVEFSYRNEMYDVVRIKFHDGITEYLCFNDVLEGKLLKTIEKYTEDGILGFISNILKKIINFNLFHIDLPAKIEIFGTVFKYWDTNLHYTSFYPEIIPPPPKCCK